MGLRTVQTCDRTVQTCDQCGWERDLRRSEKPEVGGWRTLNSGSKEATFCNMCIRRFVEVALAHKEAPDAEH